MHFYLIKYLVYYQYYFYDFKIKLVSEFKDLRIISDAKLNFFFI